MPERLGDQYLSLHDRAGIARRKRHNTVAGCTDRFKVIVAGEAVFDRHEACHAIKRFDTNQKYADVLSVEAIVAWLQAWRGGNPSHERERGVMRDTVPATVR